MRQFVRTVAAVVVVILIAFSLVRVYLAYKVNAVVQEMKWEEEQEAAAQQQEAAQIRNLEFFPDPIRKK